MSSFLPPRARGRIYVCARWSRLFFILFNKWNGVTPAHPLISTHTHRRLWIIKQLSVLLWGCLVKVFFVRVGQTVCQFRGHILKYRPTGHLKNIPFRCAVIAKSSQARTHGKHLPPPPPFAHMPLMKWHFLCPFNHILNVWYRQFSLDQRQSEKAILPTKEERLTWAYAIYVYLWPEETSTSLNVLFKLLSNIFHHVCYINIFDC